MIGRLTRTARSPWARLVVTVGLLTGVALKVDWADAARAIAHGNWAWFGAAVALLVGGLVAALIRWQLLLDGAGVASPLLHTLRGYVLGSLSNTFLPTGFGGDAVRAVFVGRSGTRLVRTLTSVFADRATAQACLVAVAWFAVVLHPDAVPGSLALALGALTAAGALVAGLLVLLVRRRPSARRRLPARICAWADEARAVARTYGRDLPLLLRTTALGIAYQLLAVSALWMLARAIDVRLGFTVAAVTAPLVLFFSLLPVSIGGFGVREASFVVLLGKAGIDAGDAVLLSLLSVAALTVSNLPGALSFLVPSRGWSLPLNREGARATVEVAQPGAPRRR